MAIDEQTAPGVLTLIEAGCRALRLEGLDRLPADVEAVVEMIKVMAGRAKLEPLAASASVPTAWLTTGEAAERLGVTPQQVNRYARAGELRSQMVGGKRLVSVVDVDSLAELRTSANVSETAVEGCSA